MTSPTVRDEREGETMTTYGIDSEDGNEITTGVQECEVRAIAQRAADRLGAEVTVYSLSGAEDDNGDWQPSERWIVAPKFIAK